MTNWIKDTMDNRGITIEELAEASILSERTISNYYKGKSKPGKKARINLLKLLDYDEDDIYYEDSAK